MKPGKLTVPKEIVKEFEWYKRYKNLNSSMFLVENSARKTRHPYYFKLKNGKLNHFPYMQSVSENYKILGYTLNFPIKSNYPSVAIMIEDKKTFEKIWYHYNKYE